ncbi:uncharacterized protein [Lolium perenne]|uniref:uncharacterized protein n=1 Tax=Lolium perenne TaxID=4522 RepID=UPI003A999FD5
MDIMIQLRVLNVIGAKNWDMSHLRGRLPNIRKLRVTKSMCYFNNNMFSEMGNIELLDFSGNTISRGMTSLSGPANSSSLKTVTIDGCDGLEIISFRNCKELKNLFLTGSFGSLEELDLSGTKVKTLDLGGVESTHPERIILLGCEKLRAILWPESVIKEEKGQYVLRIDTTSTSASTDGGESTHAHPHCDQSLQQQKEKLFKDGWQISFMDARILRPLSPGFATLHLDIYSPAILGGCVQGTSSDELVQVQPHTSTIMDSEYRDAAKDGPVEVMIMLVHVLPFFRLNKHTSCALIQEILEIVYCSDLKEVFPLDREFHAKDEIIEFPKLRFIHLHELPMLQRICGRRMRLPTVRRYTKLPKVDCEKEWWDNLEWDGLWKDDHHPSLYELSHSLYYKAQLLGVSVFR